MSRMITAPALDTTEIFVPADIQKLACYFRTSDGGGYQ
ncbi:hypothetical protein MRBBS_3630 [Marinobacter sp. BSs20148]|nr:hypothetical protein MRBBS_3630 [Marinobacter sp. BSs20148]